MLKVYLEIFDKERLRVFDKLGAFKRLGVLSGGTAIALQLKHRKSFDFDVFIKNQITTSLRRKIKKVFGYSIQVTRDETHQLDFISPEGIKTTFVSHPYPPLHPLVKTSSINLFDLHDLASNKAYTVGKRGAWRDYVDLFFLIKEGYTNLPLVISETEKRFGGEFNQRLFMQELNYTQDMTDFKVDFLRNPITPEQVKQFFKKEVEMYLKRKVRQ